MFDKISGQKNSIYICIYICNWMDGMVAKIITS
jgi:hypothetical protein